MKVGKKREIDKEIESINKKYKQAKKMEKRRRNCAIMAKAFHKANK